MLAILVRLCMLSALLLPFLRTGRAQSTPSPSPAAAPLQCYQCQASRSTYKLPPLMDGVSMAAPQPPTPSTNNTTTTTTTTAASTTLTPALEDERNKSPTNDPCWDDSFNGNGNNVIQQNCTDGAVCFKRLVRNSPAGDTIVRGCLIDARFIWSPASRNYCSNNGTYHPYGTREFLELTTSQRSAGINDLLCFCDSNLCNAASSLFSFSPMLSLRLLALTVFLFQ